MPTMQAVERPERDDTTPVPLPEVAEATDEFHRSLLPKRLKIKKL
jgi:hypothetical protein